MQIEIKGKFKVSIDPDPKDKNWKTWWYQVTYQSEELRPRRQNKRFVYTASNGWKIIMGFEPKVIVESKAIFGLGANDHRDDDVTQLIGIRNRFHALEIRKQIYEAVDELNNSDKQDWKVSEV